MNHLYRSLILSFVGMAVLPACGKREKQEAVRPNILIAIADDQSFAHTGFAGCRFVNTPGFDRIARNGIFFSNCYAGSPGSAPSRSSIVTGRYHWQNENSGQHASCWLKKYVPFVDELNANGYYTGFTGKGVEPFRYARDADDSLLRVENAAGKAFNRYSYKKGTPEDERTAGGISGTDYYANFKDFMSQRKEGEPFYFWYGAHEPHRGYEPDSWKRNGKDLSTADVPDFLPDKDPTRGDLLDYAVEIEWFDRHFVRMLNYLDSIGELDNTMVIVTADNGMPFPRAKANCFEYGIHVPLAISYPNGFPGGRTVDDPVSFVDIAPTILEMTKTQPENMQPISGRSIVGILKSGKSGVVDSAGKYVFAGRERHSSSRWNNLGYPMRAVISTDHLLIWNPTPERWPAGDPQAVDTQTGKLRPMYGIDENGKSHSDWAFTDVDESPSKAFLIENHKDPAISKYFHMAYDKHPEYELFDLKKDPFCMNNVSGSPEYAVVEKEMKEALMNELKKSSDPRVTGDNPEIFESYPRYSRIRTFPLTEEYKDYKYPGTPINNK